MGDQKPEKVITLDQPGMTSVVTKEYLVLPFTDILINRSFFLFWSGFLIIATMVGTVIAVYTDWWQALTVIVLTSLFITHPYIGFPAVFIFAGILYYKHRKGKKKQTQAKTVNYLGGR